MSRTEIPPACESVPCCNCGKTVYTCELDECTRHPEGAQLTDKRWACSGDCWEAVCGYPGQFPENRPLLGGEHVNAHTGTVYLIVEAPEDWGTHRDSERAGLLLVQASWYRDTKKLYAFNLHHPDITDHFPSLLSWIEALEATREST